MLTICWTLDQEGRLVMTFVRPNTPHPRFAYAETRQAIQKNALQAQRTAMPRRATANSRLPKQAPDAESDRSMPAPSLC